MGQQLNVWQGEFGNAYTDRNAIDWHKRLPAFRHMLNGYDFQRVLEVGCNRGHNLVALRHLLGRQVDLCGVEPNQHALAMAQATGMATVVPGHSLEVPFESASFDLVFTAGVLIHIAPDNLAATLQELYRCSRRFLLAIEYAADDDLAVTYRGQDELLWKRDYLKHYQTLFPDVRLLRQGYWDHQDGFDRANWWLLEKGS